MTLRRKISGILAGLLLISLTLPVYAPMACMLAGASILLMVERAVLGRVRRLEDWLRSCRESQKQASDVPVAGRDELATLGQEIGSTLSQARHNLERAKDEFASNVSHELLTPMSTIIGMTELCLDTELSETQRQYLSHVKQSAGHLLDSIQAILDLTALQAGEVKLHEKDFDLAAEIHEVIQGMGARAATRGLSLSLRVSAQAPDRVRGDPARLRQVVMALLDNAIKFTPAGGIEVVVRSGREAGDGGADAGRVSFGIKDTGVGIAPDKLALIFQSFSQADSSHARRHGGMGLGLSVANSLVARMGGRLGVESTPGKGSHFYFSLPLVHPEADSSPALKEALGVGGEADRTPGPAVSLEARTGRWWSQPRPGPGA